ncbi:DUF4439 domain-containing protein, partial [Desertihabitans aurantiacus]|uniref:DUF4439 domain-containing protein n=1 Tax=Desertihabitans aurantiacus TaxID=2282477 RepID=UPI000DF7E5EB
GRGLAVPAAAADYDVELDPRDQAGSATLRRDLELALVPWVGRWVAAAPDGDRAVAVDALVEGTTTAVGLGGALAVWPGWQIA